MKNSAKLMLAGLVLAVTFTATPQIYAVQDITITKHSDVSSPNLETSGSSGTPGQFSLTGLMAVIGSILGSIL